MKLGSCIHLEELRSILRSILSLVLLFTVHWLMLSVCLACQAEARHMYCFSGLVVVVIFDVIGGGVSFFVLGHFLGNYKG